MPKIELKIKNFGTLKHVLSTTGEKEMVDEKERLAPLRLSNDEASQRRHLFKKINDVFKEESEKTDALLKPFNEKFEKTMEEEKKANEKKEGEDEQKYLSRLVVKNKELVELNKKRTDLLKEFDNKEVLIDVTDKTLEVTRKYFKKYGEDNGWDVSQDDDVEEIEKAIK